MPSKPFAVPSSPPPPNQPNSFCAPWAKIVAPTPTRTASTATSPARTHPIADPPNRRPYRGGRRPAVPAAPARESTPSSTRFPPVRKPPTCNGGAAGPIGTHFDGAPAGPAGRCRPCSGSGRAAVPPGRERLPRRAGPLLRGGQAELEKRLRRRHRGEALRTPPVPLAAEVRVQVPAEAPALPKPVGAEHRRGERRGTGSDRSGDAAHAT